MSRHRTLHLVGDFMMKQRIDVLMPHPSGSGLQQVFTCYAEYQFDWDDDGELALMEQLFETFNVGTGPVAQAYRDKGLRSLSVGDVVVLDEELAFVCGKVGWDGPHDLTLYTDATT